MSYLLIAPAILASTASNIGEIGSSISSAGATAAGATTGLAAAAQDEGSRAITALFNSYGRDYQAAGSQASAVHRAVAQALSAAANAYAEAESNGAALVSSGVATVLGQPSAAGATTLSAVVRAAA